MCSGSLPNICMVFCAVLLLLLLLLQGQYQVKPPLPFIPGNEVSGVVVQVAPGVKGFRPGDLVSVCVWGGGALVLWLGEGTYLV
jgi:NADPH:quinone reductase-like Zn-dependent oxidoreductase